MSSKVLEKLPCLFSCRDTVPCDGTKVFRTGTPVCGLHLREIWGIDADYSQPQLLPDQTVQTYGPYFTTAPEVCHPIGTIVFAHRGVIDSILDNKESTDFVVNKQTVKFLNCIKNDTKLPEQYKRWVAETLRNMFESDIALRENDSGMTKSLEIRFKEITDAIKMYTNTGPLAANVEVSVGDTETSSLKKLETMPLILQQFAVHMRPAIIHNAKVNSIEFLSTTADSNIVYTTNGFIAEMPLYHRDVLVLAAETKVNMTSSLIHKRHTTNYDRTDNSLASLSECASRAYPKPVDKWDNLLKSNTYGKEYCI